MVGVMPFALLLATVLATASADAAVTPKKVYSWGYTFTLAATQ